MQCVFCAFCVVVGVCVCGVSFLLSLSKRPVCAFKTPVSCETRAFLKLHTGAPREVSPSLFPLLPSTLLLMSVPLLMSLSSHVSPSLLISSRMFVSSVYLCLIGSLFLCSMTMAMSTRPALSVHTALTCFEDLECMYLWLMPCRANMFASCKKQVSWCSCASVESLGTKWVYFRAWGGEVVKRSAMCLCCVCLCVLVCIDM